MKTKLFDQKALVKEKTELEKKLVTLTTFIFESSKYNKLSMIDMLQLNEQRESMIKYVEILAKRIRRLKTT